MASKRAKQKKVLDKAKQLVLKNKKGKAKAKPKQRYPEGQNAPQSKAYRIDNDKTQVAKATGYRFTTEGAKRLGKTESDRPTQAEVEKYRNQTFKVKGKVNKSGPKGTGDGSFRYIYIERRADKADLKRNQKLADGGNLRFYEIYDDIVDYIVKNEYVTRDVADRIVEKNMTWLRDMVEYEEENNIEYLANAIMSDDDDEYAKGGSIDDKRERVIDYYLNNDVFDDYDTYGLTEQDLMDAKKSKSYKKIEDAIVKYHGLDDDENVEERFEVLGLGDDDEYAKGGKVKEFEIDDDETGKTLIFKARSYEEALEIADKTDFNDFEDGVVVDVLIYNDDDYAKGGKTKDKKAVVVSFNPMTRVIVSSKDSEEKIVEKAREKMRDDLSDYLSVENLDEIKDDSEMPYNEKDDYAKGGKTSKLPMENDVREFQEYVFSFYGKDGIYGQDYFEGGATTEEILLATNQYLSFCAKNPNFWGQGDTMDREIVRDIILYHRGEKIDGLEHGDYIKRMKKTTILEYGGILQPMIGGVNADPRFDIYNTTMFAEDGAMLELGGENPDEMLKVTIHVDVYEDDYEEGEGKRVHGYTVDWLKNETIKADDLLNFLGRELGLSNEPNDYTIDDDGYIHTSRLEDSEGLEASQDEIDLWKLGGKKLYSAQYTIIPEAVGQSRKPSQSELHVVTDIPMYEDGGEMAKGGELKNKLKYLKEKVDGYFPNIEPKKETSYYLWEIPNNEKVSFIIERRSIYGDVGSSFYVYDKDFKYKGSANRIQGFSNVKPIKITQSDVHFADGGEMAKGGKTKGRVEEDSDDVARKQQKKLIRRVKKEINEQRVENWYEVIEELLSFAPKNDLADYVGTRSSDKKLLEKGAKKIAKDVFAKDENADELLSLIPIKNLATFIGDDDEYAKGGKIKDQYKQFPKGSFKREKGVWNAWTPAQRLHFLNDHGREFLYNLREEYKNKISKVDYDGLSDLDDDEDLQEHEIFIHVNDALNKHIKEGQYADGGKTMSRKVLTRRYLQGRAKNIFTFGYGMPKDAIDMYGTKGGSEYFVMPNGDVYKKTTADMHKFELIDVKDKS